MFPQDAGSLTEPFKTFFSQISRTNRLAQIGAQHERNLAKESPESRAEYQTTAEVKRRNAQICIPAEFSSLEKFY